LISFVATGFNILNCIGKMSHSFVVSSPSTAYKSLSTTSVTTKIKKCLKIPKEIIKAKELKNDKELKKYQELKSCIK
jgi:hypothetical protein